MGMDGGIGAENDHNSLYKCMKPANNKRMGGDWPWMTSMCVPSSLRMYVICVCMFTYTCMYINSHDMLIHCFPFYLPLLLEKIYEVGIPINTPCLVSFGNLRTTISKSLWPCDFPSFGSGFIHGLRKLHEQKQNETLDWSSSGVVLASCWLCSPWWGSSVSCSSWWFLHSFPKQIRQLLVI